MIRFSNFGQYISLKPMEPMLTYSERERAFLPNPILEIQKKIHAEMVDMNDKVIVDAIINGAVEAGITDLYLLNKQFILDAIREKMERDGLNGF